MKKPPKIQDVFKNLEKAEKKFIDYLIQSNPMFSILNNLYPYWVIATLKTKYYNALTNEIVNIEKNEGWMYAPEVKKYLFDNQNIKIVSEIAIYTDLFDNMNLNGIIFINPQYLTKNEIPIIDSKNTT